MSKHLILSTSSAILIAIASGGWIHGTAAPNYKNWHEAYANVPCQNVKETEHHHLEIVGPVVVDGKSYQEHDVNGEDEIRAIEKRCSLKG